MVAMEVAAAKATLEPREGMARRKARKAASQTVRIGERKRESTEWKNEGWEGNVVLVEIFVFFFFGEGEGKEEGDLRDHRRG